MKILFLTSRFPYPPLRGDQAIPYYRLKYLSKRHSITLLSFYEHARDLEGLNHLRQYCKNIFTIALPFWRSLLNVAVNSLLSPLPLQVLYYRSFSCERLVKKLIAENGFDIVHAYLLRMAPYVEGVNSPRILELIDSMQLNWSRRLATEKNPMRWVVKEELRRIISYENHIGSLFNKLIVVSEKDRAMVPASNLDVVPLGVDTDLFAPNPEATKDTDIIFSGNMGYSPNIRAVLWFVENCLPKIQKIFPKVKFEIVGINPSREIRSLAQREGIVVTGYVKSMPEALTRASVSVAPMLSGSGMQFKIIEAMSCGLPVVTTTLGLGDIKAKPHKDILVSDEPEGFAESVISLLSKRDCVREIGSNARNYVIRNHGWEDAVGRVESIYASIAVSRSGIR